MPRLPALLGQPVVQSSEIRPALATGHLPDLPTAIQHVLLDDAFLPASGTVAEFRVEQVMSAHGVKSGIDGAFLAAPDFVDGGLHVVVDAAPGDATESGKGAGMRIKEHFVALCRIGDQPEGTTGAEFHVRNFDASAQAANEHVLAAPVKLEGFAERETERNIGSSLGVGFNVGFPAPDEGADASVAARIALRLQCLMEMNGGATLSFVALPVGLQPLPQLFGPRVENTDDLALRVVRLLHRRLTQPVPDGVAG